MSGGSAAWPGTLPCWGSCPLPSVCAGNSLCSGLGLIPLSDWQLQQSRVSLGDFCGELLAPPGWLSVRIDVP